jgi:hypothetical protein
MAIITEYYKTREDGVVLNRSYSDKGMKIERDGVRYDEAIDPVDTSRVYVETDIAIDAAVHDDALLEEKAKAYDIVTGEG